MASEGTVLTHMEHTAYRELFELEPDHWWYRGMRQITDQVLRRVVERRPNLQILDAGCGVGGNVTALGRFGPTHGVDFSPLALDYARRSHVERLTRASVEALPYADDSFDLVTSFDVLYCREVGSDVQALAEFARVLRPGGHVLVRVPALSSLRGPHDTVVHGVRRYTAAELRQKMACVGLLPLYLTYLNSLLLPIIFAIRQFQNLSVQKGAAPRSDVQKTSPVLNMLLFKILQLEARWIARGYRFPAGVSVLGLAVKPARVTVRERSVVMEIAPVAQPV